MNYIQDEREQMSRKVGGYKQFSVGNYLITYGLILLFTIILFLSLGFVISVQDRENEEFKGISTSHFKQ